MGQDEGGKQLNIWIVVGIVVAVAIVAGVFFSFPTGVQEQQSGEDLTATDVDESADVVGSQVSDATRNSIEDLPSTNPFEVETNPFEGYKNPFGN